MSDAVLVLPAELAPTSAEVDEYGVPTTQRNHIWYEYNDSDTVVVFVHGIFSNSRTCWTHKPKTSIRKSLAGANNSEGKVYWPRLVLEDSKFGRPSIFLSGFYTELINSGDYKIRDAAEEIYKNLSISIDGTEPVLSKKNIVFITHSTGGIAVRHMLVKKLASFSSKNVLLFLIASPSLGAADADRLEWLAKKAKQELGLQLMLGNPFLDELDKDFKDLVNEKKIPNLSGVEAIENHFIVRWMGLFSKEVLVKEESAARYFGSPKRLANTDHFTTVKPDGDTHPSHVLLKYHWKQYMERLEGQ